MSEEVGLREMTILKTIAETLNTSNDLSIMLDTVLGKLLELTGLAAGWIFFSDGSPDYNCAIDKHLPPALQIRNKEPMKQGTCWCLNRMWDGRLDYAVNILNCKRLENAVEYQWGDTLGITHHATIPLRSSDRVIGLLNVAAPGKESFSENELALLQSVAYQLGGAVERMRLYQMEQHRAEQYARLGELSVELGTMVDEYSKDPRGWSEWVIRLVRKYFGWPFIALLHEKDRIYSLQTAGEAGNVFRSTTELPATIIELLDRSKQPGLRDARHVVQVPVAQLEAIASYTGYSWPSEPTHRPDCGRMIQLPFSLPEESGRLFIGLAASNQASTADQEIIEVLSEHIVAAWESLRLVEQRRELARLEERNRLARDLHDSVNQMLFSLSLTAKGVESMLGHDSTPHPAVESVRDMRLLAQQALQEMRALILQLRPIALNSGLLAALQEYGARQGLQVHMMSEGQEHLPPSIEEGLWRVGQEALNNVRKHAGVTNVNVTLRNTGHEVELSISDRGQGGAKRRGREVSSRSLGLSIMKERVESLRGRFELTSSVRKGTTVTAIIPLPLSDHAVPRQECRR